MSKQKFTNEQIIRCLNECHDTEFVVADLVDNGDTETVTFDRIVAILNSQQQEIETLRDNNEHLVVILEETKAETKKEFIEKIKALLDNNEDFKRGVFGWDTSEIKILLDEAAKR